MNVNVLCKHLIVKLMRDTGARVLLAGAGKPRMLLNGTNVVELPDPGLLITKQAPKSIDLATPLMK